MILAMKIKSLLLMLFILNLPLAFLQAKTEENSPDDYSIIYERDLFNLAPKKKGKPVVIKPLFIPLAQRLRLKGIITKENPLESLAVIEILGGGKQEIYRVGNLVENGKILEILKESVVLLNEEGKEERLLLAIETLPETGRIAQRKTASNQFIFSPLLRESGPPQQTPLFSQKEVKGEFSSGGWDKTLPEKAYSSSESSAVSGSQLLPSKETLSSPTSKTTGITTQGEGELGLSIFPYTIGEGGRTTSISWKVTSAAEGSETNLYWSYLSDFSDSDEFSDYTQYRNKGKTFSGTQQEFSDTISISPTSSTGILALIYAKIDGREKTFGPIPIRISNL